MGSRTQAKAWKALGQLGLSSSSCLNHCSEKMPGLLQEETSAQNQGVQLLQITSGWNLDTHSQNQQNGTDHPVLWAKKCFFWVPWGFVVVCYIAYLWQDTADTLFKVPVSDFSSQFIFLLWWTLFNVVSSPHVHIRFPNLLPYSHMEYMKEVLRQFLFYCISCQKDATCSY